MLKHAVLLVFSVYYFEVLCASVLAKCFVRAY
jgi:hypothetical protein